MYSYPFTNDTLEADIIYINNEMFNSYKYYRLNDPMLYYSIKNLKLALNNKELDSILIIRNHAKWMSRYLQMMKDQEICILKIEEIKFGFEPSIIKYQTNTLYEWTF
jgi:hypothetical protein